MKIKEFYEAVVKDPKGFNFQKALEEHTLSPDYMPYKNIDDLTDKLSKHLDEKKDGKVIQIGYEILEHNAFDIEAHSLISQAAFRLKRTSLFNLHNYIASTLIDLIIQSGDGKSYLTAYKVYFPKDELAIFCFLKKYPQGRSTHEKMGKFFDIYQFKENENLFFDISIPFQHLAGEEERTR